jgi:hypothetical protein
MTSTDFSALPPPSPFGRFLLPATALLLGLLYLFTRQPFSPPLLTALAGLACLAYLPGLAASLWIERRVGVWATWVLPLILSPVITTGWVLLLARFGAATTDTPLWLVAASVAAVVLAPRSGRELEDRAVSLDSPGILRVRADRHRVILVSSVVLGVIAVTLLHHDWLLATGDAAWQTAVARLTSDGLPPEDPFLAGFRLRHWWAFGLYLDTLGYATGLDPATTLIGGSLLAGFTLVFAGYRALTLLAEGHLRSLTGAAFLFLGLGAAFPLTVLLPAAVSGTAGAAWDSLVRLDPEVLHRLFPAGRAFFLEALLPAGPLASALVQFALFLAAAVAGVGERRVPTTVLAGIALFGMLLFHPPLGLVVALTTLVAVPAGWLVLRLAPHRGDGGRLTLLLVPVIAALVLASPYLVALVLNGGFAPRTHLGPSPERLVGLLLPLGVDLVFAGVVLVRFLAGEDRRRQWWAVWCLLLLVVTVSVGFGGRDPLRAPLFLLHVPLALTAGLALGGWGRSRGGAWRLAAVLLGLALLSPRTVLGLAAYDRADDPRDDRPASRETALWIERELDPDAVLVDDRADLALEARRTLLYESLSHIDDLGYSGYAVPLRTATQFDLLRGNPLTPEQRDHLLRLNRPVYVVRRLPDQARNPDPPESEVVHERDGLVLHLWTPSRRRTP